MSIYIDRIRQTVKECIKSAIDNDEFHELKSLTGILESIPTTLYSDFRLCLTPSSINPLPVKNGNGQEEYEIYEIKQKDKDLFTARFFDLTLKQKVISTQTVYSALDIYNLFQKYYDLSPYVKPSRKSEPTRSAWKFIIGDVIQELCSKGILEKCGRGSRNFKYNLCEDYLTKISLHFPTYKVSVLEDRKEASNGGTNGGTKDWRYLVQSTNNGSLSVNNHQAGA